MVDLDLFLQRERLFTQPLACLGCDLFVGEAWNIGTLPRVLDRNAADVAVAIHIQKSILVQVLGLGDLGCLELNVKRVRVLEILNLHGLNERSKKALWTVSPSGSSITRKYLPSISAMGAYRRIRPSC